MKKNKNLLDSDLEKRFEKLEEGHPEPEKTNKKDLMVKIIIGVFAVLFVGLMLFPLINF